MDLSSSAWAVPYTSYADAVWNVYVMEYLISFEYNGILMSAWRTPHDVPAVIPHVDEVWNVHSMENSCFELATKSLYQVLDPRATIFEIVGVFSRRSRPSRSVFP